MKKIMAVAAVVAMFALSSTTLMAAPTKGATKAAGRSGLSAKVVSMFVTATPAQGKAKGKGSKGLQDPGKSTNDGAIWCWYFGVNYCR